MKKLALVLVIVMLFSLVLVGGASAAEAADSAVLKVCLPEEPSILLALRGNLGIGNYVGPCVFDTLFYFNSDTQEIEPNLATDYEWIDETHLRLTLRDDVVAYDGTILTADDVLYSVQQGLAGDAKMQWKYINGDECSVEDETHFVLGLTEAHPTIISMLAGNSMLTVIDQSSVEANGGYDECLRTLKCNTGAYNLVEWKSGESIVLERNENYWGEAPYYDSIEFTFINDSASRVMSLQAGSVNIAADLSGADVLSIQDPYQVLTMSTGGCYVIFPNVTNEALSNELVRKAIALTINPEALNQIGSLGQGKIATSLVPSDNPIYAEPDDEYETGVNIEKAKELMEEAGYGDGFDLYMPTLGPIQVESQAIQADLLQIGINVKVEVVELPIYLMASDTGDLDLSYQCTTPDDIANMLNYFDDRLPSMSRGGGIIGGDPELYPLIDACRNDGTSEDWAAFQNYIRDHYLMIPVYENSFFLGADAGYTVRHDGIGYADFRTIQPAA